MKIRELELSTLWIQSRRGEKVWVIGSHIGRCGFLFIYIFISETESNDLHQAGPEIRDPSASDSHMLTHGYTKGFQQTYEGPKSWRAELCGQEVENKACTYSVGQQNSQELVQIQQLD